MLVISSAGASPDSLSFYLRTKGEMEKGLEQLGIPSTTVLRPGLLLGKREEFRLAERLGQSLLPIFGYKGTPIDSLARFLVNRIFESHPGFSIVENTQILGGPVKQS